MSADISTESLQKRIRVALGQEPADLVLTRARTIQELISRPQTDRVVVVDGRAIDSTPPDYRELDRLIAR